MNHTSLVTSDKLTENLETGLQREMDIILEVSKGNERAFSELYQIYSHQIYNFLSRLIGDAIGADDVLQEVFLGIWRGAKNFKQKSSVKTWIYQIAHKQAVSWIRRHERENRALELTDQFYSSQNLEETALINVEYYRIQKAISSLSLKHKMVLELAFAADMSYAEIAEVLHCPIGTVKSRMNTALRQLNSILSGQDSKQAGMIGSRNHDGA